MCGLLVLFVVVVFLAWGWWCCGCCRHGGAKDVRWKPRIVPYGCCIEMVGVRCAEQMQVVCDWLRVVVAKFGICGLVVWDLGELVPFFFCGQIVQWVKANSDAAPKCWSRSFRASRVVVLVCWFFGMGSTCRAFSRQVISFPLAAWWKAL